MKGNEAIGEAAARAGCNIFCGYPITPSSEALEYVSHRFPALDRHFIQAESEIAAINMIIGAAAAGFRTLTATSGPGFDLYQEGLSYLASYELPCVIVDIARYGAGLGMIQGAQNDYFQATKGGGHGNYRLLVYAPQSVQESVDLVTLAYDKSDELRIPVLILSDGVTGQIMEPVELPEMQPCDHEKNKTWALRGKGEGARHRTTDRAYYDPHIDDYYKKKYALIEENEQLWEEINTEDADIILVAYGISSRICREAVDIARESGIKLGLFRPITLWPFPRKALLETAKTAKAYLAVEMSLGQMVEDVALSLKGTRPVYSLATGKETPRTDNIIKMVEDIMNNSIKEVF
jgi:2-oxoglutarate ferredoxin oxidoreductase subunit alpha